MKKWELSLALILFLCCTSTAQDKKPHQVPPPSKARKQPLLITIDMPNATIKVGSAISVNILMTNKSRNSIGVGRGDWGTGGLVVRDSQGNESLTELERCARGGGPCNTSSNPSGPCDVEGEQCQTLYYLPLGGGPSIGLDPGKSYSESAGVNRRAYDLSRPGKYTIQWEGRQSSGPVMKSNAITLTIIP